MSQPISKADVLYAQRVCGLCGLYDGPIDGKWSSALGSSEDLLASQSTRLGSDFGTYDLRTERNITSLVLPAQKLARRFMKIASTFSPLTVKIISGSRTYAEQDALYAIGRTVQITRGHVTNAKGGQSNHNFGLAWDVGIFEADGRYMDGKLKRDPVAYAELAKRVGSLKPDLQWGGDWATFKDVPHYQLSIGSASVADTRKIFEAGKPLPA